MPEIRFHGRGGQGAVVASRLIAEAAFIEGYHVQAFPAFGLERRGAPVMAFTRIQDSPINDHSQIYEPDIVVVLDAGLLDIVNVCDGLKKGGHVLVNSSLPPAELPGLENRTGIGSVDASAIAVEHGLGTATSPIVNTAILGALAGFTACVELESVLKAIEKNVKIKPDANIEACREAFDIVITPSGTGLK